MLVGPLAASLSLWQPHVPSLPKSSLVSHQAVLPASGSRLSSPREVPFVSGLSVKILGASCPYSLALTNSRKCFPQLARMLPVPALEFSLTLNQKEKESVLLAEQIGHSFPS